MVRTFNRWVQACVFVCEREGVYVYCGPQTSVSISLLWTSNKRVSIYVYCAPHRSVCLSLSFLLSLPRTCACTRSLSLSHSRGPEGSVYVCACVKGGGGRRLCRFHPTPDFCPLQIPWALRFHTPPDCRSVKTNFPFCRFSGPPEPPRAQIHPFPRFTPPAESEMVFSAAGYFLRRE